MPRSFTAELKAMGVSPEQIATARMPDGTLLSEYEQTSKRSDAWAPYKSEWEMLYAMELEDQKRAGVIIDWQYEGIRLKVRDERVCDGATVNAKWYTPDFAIWFADGRFEFVEVKGYQREEGILRYEMARSRFPHIEFTMVSRTKAGWEVIM